MSLSSSWHYISFCRCPLRAFFFPYTSLFRSLRRPNDYSPTKIYCPGRVGAHSGRVWQCPSGALYLRVWKSELNDFGTQAIRSASSREREQDMFVTNSVFLVESRHFLTRCFIRLFLDFLCRSLCPGIISPVVGVRFVHFNL